MAKCICNLCLARELNCHHWELHFGRDSLEAKYIRKYPNKPIYWYEVASRLEHLLERDVTQDEINTANLDCTQIDYVAYKILESEKNGNKEKRC